MSHNNNKTPQTTLYSVAYLSQLPRTPDLENEAYPAFSRLNAEPERFFDAHELAEKLSQLPQGTKVLVPNTQGQGELLLADHGRITAHACGGQYFVTLTSTTHVDFVTQAKQMGVAYNVSY